MTSALACTRAIAVLVAVLARSAAEDDVQATVGAQPDGRYIVPSNQVLSPAGRQVIFPGRPVDLAWADGGSTLVIKSDRHLLFVEIATGGIQQLMPSPDKGFSVTGLVVHGSSCFVSDSTHHIQIAQRSGGAWAWTTPIALAPASVGGEPFPAGMALVDDVLAIASSRANRVDLVPLSAGSEPAALEVGVAPYSIVPAAGKLFVSEWGGQPPKPGEPQQSSSGTMVHIDAATGVADQGTVSVLRKAGAGWSNGVSIAVGLHPCGMAANAAGTRLYVANASSDTVSVIDAGAEAVVETIDCRPEARLPFGSGCNAVALSPDQQTLYVANGTNNCIAVVSLDARATGGAGGAARTSVIGLIPTGWYPGAVLVSADGKLLAVANVKGVGALAGAAKKRNSREHLGSVSLIPVPDAATLARWTQEVRDNDRTAYSLAGLEPPRPSAPPAPVPERHGEASRIKHVVYVIKENRTYDQVLGDMKEGNGDPALVMFGEDVTPNQHALARQFTLLDNFYCSGVLSADGHSWVNAAYVTDYLEKSFGGFARSYPCNGEDPLAFPGTGFLWSNALAHGLDFHNFGEFTFCSFTPGNATRAMLLDEAASGGRTVRIDVHANIAAMAAHTQAGYPGFDLRCPDTLRAQLFIAELKRWEAAGAMPALVYLYLPCDHTEGLAQGQPTPRAMVADNDLALGQAIAAISASRFWTDTCVMVVEDDPQNGFDHVDGHRTVAFAISPYTRRGFVDHTCYNQTGMVKTIELMLGLPAMNQLDLSATAMRACFQATPDATPFTCTPNRIKLDELARLDAGRGEAGRRWALASSHLDFSAADRADEDTLNRVLWFSTHGEETYPAAFVCARDADGEDEQERAQDDDQH